MKIGSKKFTLVIILIIVTFLVCSLFFSFNNSINDKNKHIRNLSFFEEYYLKRIEQFEKENGKAKNVDVIFIGDSLTDGCDLNKYYPSFTTLNRGISGDTTTGVFKRLDVSVKDVESKVVVMLIGVNNIDEMMNDYEDILKWYKENVPERQIVLLSLTCMTGNWARLNEKAIVNNQLIKNLSIKYDYHFIDLFTPLCNPITNELYDEYTIDGGHFTNEGYIVISKIVNEVLSSIIE